MPSCADPVLARLPPRATSSLLLLPHPPQCKRAPVRMRSSSALKVMMGVAPSLPPACAARYSCSAATSSISWGLKCG